MTKVFITGATGFIGGTILEQLTTAYPSLEVTAIVRDPEKGVQVAAKFPSVATVVGDLDSTELLEAQAALADIVINTADCDHQESARAIIRGIEKRGGGYLIHTSGIAMLLNEPDGNIVAEKVWDDIEDLEELSSFPDSAIHRPVERIILAAPPSVHTAIISPGKVYGVGTGPGKVYTFPIIANAMISAGTTFLVGSGAPRMASIHIRDLARIFILLVREALKPNGGTAQWDAEGYYFGQSGEISIVDHTRIVGEELAKLGLVKSKEPEPYTIEQLAKIHPFYPLAFASGARCTASRARRLGWRPVEAGVRETLADDIRLEYSGGNIQKKPEN